MKNGVKLVARDFFESIVDLGLEPMEDHAIRAFDFSVCARKRDRCPVDTDVMIVTKFKEMFSCEVYPVIHDDGVRDSKAVDNVLKESGSLH